MNITPTKAVKLFKVSKPTLYNDMKSGKLSFELDGRKKRKINVAELDRLYDKREKTDENLTSKSVKSENSFTGSNVNESSLKREIENIREQIQSSHKREIELMNNQIEQLQSQLENLNKNLDKALDVTALLEDKRAGQGAKETKIDEKFKNMESVIEELRLQNKRLLDKESERQKKSEERRKQRELEAAEKEKNKPLLKRLFG